ncbi:hypothetical protein DFA_09579 [Cavenderia fasciculata]|uniref:Uncharacterized protein n=1 Tax=Cavenderia fasciculata TaxID=261658 RepID=F4Q810_CACFS|nr:hypothetical protein DFA_09579 [Cavenderia fasciculata]EGG15910.1 hypothetical protein DFA_09579 [Cavenderia fasciculata]|eukprot:XP_004352235.1 hypothetical protein DFA_09579 [Cavenderia fasciculata]
MGQSTMKLNEIWSVHHHHVEELNLVDR